MRFSRYNEIVPEQHPERMIAPATAADSASYVLNVPKTSLDTVGYYFAKGK
jgi:predicted metal-dependent TIM-barrel fold hydrolase